MSTKNNHKPYGKETSYSGEILSKMRNAKFPELAPFAGSKNRLRQYRNNLKKSQGTESALFDSKLIDLVRKYSLNLNDVDASIEYLNSLVDDEGYSFSRNLKLYCKTEEAMLRFAQPDHAYFGWCKCFVQSREKLRKRFSGLKLKPEKYESDDDILKALPKVDTHSGFYYFISGKKKKGENIEGLCNQLKERKKQIHLTGTAENYPILLGFRTQASGEFEDDGSPTGKCKHKTRVVSMCDIRHIVFELQFSNPIQRVLNSMEFYAGGKNDHEISKILFGFMQSNTRFLSIDYSSYDQTISGWLIREAFDVLHSAFSLTPNQEKEWSFMVDAFINKRFIVSEGVVESSKGIPSGFMFTQIIGSIVNALVVNTYFNSINSKCDMIAMGDDNAIFCRGDADIDHLASYLSKNFGLVVKTDDKSNEGVIGRDNVKFLSRYWTYSGPWRHPHQILSRMAFPERFRDYNNDVKPEHVLYSYYLAYPSGVRSLVDMNRFVRDFPLVANDVLNKVDSRYIPGNLAYRREYTKVV